MLKLIHSRVAKVEQASKNRFHHTIKFTNIQEIDDELMGWLKTAYELKK